MSREVFRQISPHPATVAVIDQANVIIDEYASQGFVLTLRQLYYQFVARDWLPNTIQQYRRLGRIVRDGRDGGLIDWNGIEDRTREVNTHSAWDDPAHIIKSAARSYAEDLWRGQRYRPEVWIEKDALLGVIEDICTEYQVPYFAHRGNNSQTLQYQAGKRFANYLDQGLIPVVLHLADHDPNGRDMTRDNIERLALYARQDVEVRRIGLNMDQVRRYRLPPNFAKESDTRFEAYVREFRTRQCWELDALSPTVIADLIRVEIERLIDHRAFETARRHEACNRKLMTKVSTNWTLVEKSLQRRQ